MVISPFGLKPPVMARLNPRHPLNRGLAFFLPLNEGGGFARDLVTGAGAGFAGGLSVSHGLLGYAMDSDASAGSYIDFPYNPLYALVNSPITLMARFRCDVADNVFVFAKLFDTTDTSPFAEYSLVFDGTTSGGTIKFRIGGTRNFGATGSLLGKDIHVACVADGSNMLFYLNGVLDNTVSFSGLPADTNSRPIRIGANADGGERFQGSISYASVHGRVLSQAEILEDFRNPFGTSNNPRLISRSRGSAGKVASGGVSGTLAKTNANDTLSASGASTVNGSLAKTNANDTISSFGSPIVNGSLAKTNANDTLSASGSVGVAITGTLATTNANDALSGDGTITVTGSLAKTNANDSLAASGSPTVNGSLAKTNANDTLSASGSPVVSGTLAKTNANDTLAASGIAGSPTGSLAYTNANDSTSASGGPTVTGSASVANANDTLSAFGMAGASIQGGGAVIVDLPKRRGRKPKKVPEPTADQAETLPAPVKVSRIISEEEAAGMAAIYGIPEKQAEIAPVLPQESEIMPEAEPADTLEPFQIPESVYGSAEVPGVLEGSELAQPTGATEVPEEDDIALILAIIEAIG